MNQSRLLVAGIMVLGVALLCGVFFTREDADLLNTSPKTTGAVNAISQIISPPARAMHSDTSAERVSMSEPTDWSNLRRRLDGMAPRLSAIEVQREVNRLVQHWFRSDRAAALAWIFAHRGDVRFDPVAASVAQSLVALGDFGEAQKLADGITDPSVSDWVHQEAWSVALERGLVTADQIKNSGLPQAAVNSVLSGAHRD